MLRILQKVGRKIGVSVGLIQIRQGVRRNLDGEGWSIADEVHDFFIGSFSFGLMSNVTFIHEAPPMRCVFGYESTGEVFGVIEGMFEKQAALPKTVVRQTSVKYDRTRRVFHDVEDPNKKIDSADFLLLNDNKTAIACWTS